MAEDGPTFGELLRPYRLAVHLTQEELAERAGLSRRAIQELERGTRRRPRRETIHALADALVLDPQARASLESAARWARTPGPNGKPPSIPGPELHQPITSFIGREGELGEIHRLLNGERLVTLTGPGGVGKTRLALQVAAGMLERYADGVRVADLAPLTQQGLVPYALASVVGVRPEPGQAVLDTLASALRSRQLLMVLDNCEHLIDECARAADALIHACPRLAILATSREALGIVGETIWQVRPLAVPDPGGIQTVESVIQFEAVRLLVDRGLAVKPSFAVTVENASAVAQVCQRLDGIPLAIELAAARLRVLTPGDIVERLDDRFQLLTGGGRTALPRHQTLRALVDWSYDLVSDKEKALFRRLSVFAGGWSLAAAEAACSGELIERWEVLDLLSALVDKSLVQVDDPSRGHMRYRLLETLREYGSNRLADAGESTTTLNQHAGYYVAEVEQIERVRQTDWSRWRREYWPWVLAEHDNIRAVLGRCLDGDVDADGQAELGLRLWSGMWWFWCLHEGLAEGWGWYESLLASTPARVSVARFWAVWCASVTAVVVGRFTQAVALAGDSLELAVALADDQAIAMAESQVGSALLHQGRLVEAAAACDRGLALGRRVGPRYSSPIFPFQSGWTALRQGRLDRAAEWLDESIIAARQIADDFCLTLALPLRGTVSLLQQDLVSARAYLGEAASLAKDLPNRGLDMACIGLAQLALLQGDTDEAARQFGTTLEDATQFGRRILITESLEGLALVAVARGDGRGGASLLAAMDVLRASIDQRRPPDDERRVQAALAPVRKSIGETDFDAACAAGRDLPLDEAIVYGRRLARPQYHGTST